MYSVSKKEQRMKLLSEEQSKNSKCSEDTESQKPIEKEEEKDFTIITQRLGSIRRSSHIPESRHNLGFVNNGFISEEDKVFHEAVEIVKELPALHLEHCKL